MREDHPPMRVQLCTWGTHSELQVALPSMPCPHPRSHPCAAPALPLRSACRAVRYCSTACSRADWRAGHRRVCKALGLARAARKERKQAAAAVAPSSQDEQGGEKAGRVFQPLDRQSGCRSSWFLTQPVQRARGGAGGHSGSAAPAAATGEPKERSGPGSSIAAHHRSPCGAAGRSCSRCWRHRQRSPRSGPGAFGVNDEVYYS